MLHVNMKQYLMKVFRITYTKYRSNELKSAFLYTRIINIVLFFVSSFSKSQIFSYLFFTFYQEMDVFLDFKCFSMHTYHFCGKA